MSVLSVPLPADDPIARPRRKNIPVGQKDDQEGLCTDVWIKYLQNREDAITAAPQRNASTSVSAQSASIGATSIPTQALNAGLYRVTFYATVTTQATVSSSLEVTISWTDIGQARFITSTAYTGNSVSGAATGSVMFYADAGAPVTYSTTYATVGATDMVYSLQVVLEKVDA